MTKRTNTAVTVPSSVNERSECAVNTEVDSQGARRCASVISFAISILLCGACGDASSLLDAAPLVDGPPPALSAPLGVHRTNPRYFADGSGRAVYLTGSHIWFTVVAGPTQYAPRNPSMSDGEFVAFLDWLELHGHNFTRLWTALSYLDYGGPFPWTRPGPGTASDGRPVLDMTSFDQGYFDLLRRRVLEIQARGMYASVMFFGSHNGMKSAFWNVAWHPDNNVNAELAAAFDPADGYSFFTTDPAAIEIQRALVQKTIDTLNDVDNIIWEIINEPGGTPAAVAWHEAMIDYVHTYEAGKPKQHLVGMTGGWNLGPVMLSSPADWVSPDWDAYKEGGPGAYASKIAIVDTDHLSNWYQLRPGIEDDVRRWVWKTFCRGNHPILMDLYDLYDPEYGAYGVLDPLFDPLRGAMGLTRGFAERFADLSRMEPSETLASTGYCLADPGVEYLVYQPLGDTTFTVDLSAGNYDAEWLDASAGVVAAITVVTAPGGPQEFTAPFLGDAVLHLGRRR